MIARDLGDKGQLTRIPENKFLARNSVPPMRNTDHCGSNIFCHNYLIVHTCLSEIK